MSRQLRALVGARVSVVQGPQKVSHKAQIESASNWAAANGADIVGTFEDLGVSASIPPQERPDLGRWLTLEGAEEWDVIVWAKMDRAFRSTRHCVDFAQWAEEHRKVVVFAEDGLRLDYRPGAAKGIDAMMAELFVYLGSFFAQLELNRFKTRAQDSHRILRGMDRWASGVPPLGFRVIDHPSGKGRGLDTDPEGKAVLYDIAGKLIEGWSFIRIAQWCNDEGLLTNMDRARVAAGQPAKARPWSVSNVIESLTSPRTQGLKMTGKGKNAKTVLDADGEPIRMAPPTFDPDTWRQVQEAAAKRRSAPRSQTRSTNPMLGVGVCALCGASLAQQFSKLKRGGDDKVYRSYRCGRTPLNCNGVSIRADDADLLLEEMFLSAHGDEYVTRRVFVPGEDHSEDLELVRATIDRLRRESDMGLVVSPEDERVYVERMKALIDRRTKLEAVPRRAAGWVTEQLDHTYRDAWDAQDHRQLLIDRGIRFKLTSSKPMMVNLTGPPL